MTSEHHSTPLREPAEPLRGVIDDADSLKAAAQALAAGQGPIAIDAERASGYRYGQQAYLVQLRRAGAGTFLIDPVGLDLTPLADAIEGPQWVLHAATQDLPCLFDLGLRPSELFDTELGARLAGLPKVGLAAVVEHYLGLSLAKEHSAVDWSTRPLPREWLIYAALDVEVLVEVRYAMEADLRAKGTWEWARQEFEHLLGFRRKEREDPWRRTSGSHRLRRPPQLAALRELWQAREAMAQERDVTPSRVMPDQALIALAAAPVPHAEAMPDAVRKGLTGRDGRSATAGDTGARARHRQTTSGADPRTARRVERAITTLRGHQDQWWAALQRAAALPEEALPPMRQAAPGPPPARAWAERDPRAAARLTEARAVLGAVAQDHGVPVENVLSPSLLREVLWSPPQQPETVATALRAGGAREWQVHLVEPIVREAIRDSA